MRRIRTWLLFALWLVGACGREEEAVDGPIDSVDGDGEQSDAATETPTDQPVGDMTGLWAMKYAVTQNTFLPVFSRDATLVTFGLALTPVEHDGTDFRFTERLCSLNMEIVENIDFNVIFTEQSLEAVPRNPRHAILAEPAQGAAFHHDPIFDFFGFDYERMDDPLTDPLPAEAGDPLVLDMEDDGHPGVTARINGMVQGEIYVVFRLSRTLDGTVANGGLIEGDIAATAEMVTLGADPELLKIQLELRPNERPELNHFQYVKLDAETMDCAELIERQDELFTYDPLDYVEPRE